MTFYKNDPKYEILYMSKNIPFNRWKWQNQEAQQNTKAHIFKFLINQVQTVMNPVYNRGYRGNLHQFQWHTM